LVKYLRIYGLAIDEAASLMIARRAMQLSENIPGDLTAYFEVNSEKHLWSQWNQLNKKIKRSGGVSRRCDYCTISNRSFLSVPRFRGSVKHAYSSRQGALSIVP